MYSNINTAVESKESQCSFHILHACIFQELLYLIYLIILLLFTTFYLFLLAFPCKQVQLYSTKARQRPAKPSYHLDCITFKEVVLQLACIVHPLASSQACSLASVVHLENYAVLLCNKYPHIICCSVFLQPFYAKKMSVLQLKGGKLQSNIFEFAKHCIDYVRWVIRLCWDQLDLFCHFCDKLNGKGNLICI